MNKKIITTAIAACGFIVAVSMPLTVNADNKELSAYGKTYGEWSAEWVKWASSSPENRNPIVDETGAFCDVNQPKGDVWFLAGSFNKAGVVRDCPIPANKALFYPIIEGMWVDCPDTADVDNTDTDVRKIMAAYGDAASLLTSTLDDAPVSSLDIPIVRIQSPKFISNLSVNNIWNKSRTGCPDDLPAGKSGRMIADGYWVMIPPLQSGSHTLTLHGAAANWTLDNKVNHGISTGWVVDPNGNKVDIDVTYNLTVLGKGHDHEHGHNHHK